ncbi:MAG: aldehyde dehydrogenase family protein [Propionibacteriaceae bacterium]|nr:aldehyde dehydrogenase family protein [Propionibacteriaceae bacterium]
MREFLRAEADRAVVRLASGVAGWAERSLPERAALIRATHASVATTAASWVAAALAAKGTLSPRDEAEEWLSGPYALLSACLATATSLESLSEGRSPADGLRLGTGPGGRTTARVLPANGQERTLLHGFWADVWFRPGVTPDEVRARAGLGARERGAAGVAAVLGAGNVSAIGPLDALDQLVTHNRASILKVNPVFAGLVPGYQRALAPLIEADLLWIVDGDEELGDYLVRHPGIAHVHLTGSRATHDAIVWGPGPKGEQRRAFDEPRISASISSELGNVSPTIVVPGEWTAADLRYQAEQVVSQRLHNSGHNCIATQILILSSDWNQRGEFLTEIRKVLRALPRRDPWYAGSDRLMAALSESHPNAELYSGCYLVELAPDQPDENLFTEEFFAPALGHTSLAGSGAEFLRAAVGFANEHVAGTLGASIIVAPENRHAMGAEFDEAVADLRYGVIGINVWSGFVFAVPTVPWGAYPGHTRHEPGSGSGVVHNSLLLADTERTVAGGPFRPFPRSLLHHEFALCPKPPWLVTARGSRETARRLTAYAEDPSWGRLLAVLPSAFRG